MRDAVSTHDRADDRAAVHDALVERLVAAEVAREATARAARWAEDELAAAGVAPQHRPVPPRLRYPRWGWRRAIRVAVERRMVTPRNLGNVLRLARHRLEAQVRRQRIEIMGMAFVGRRVELWATADAGRLVIGPWAWIGDASALRSHAGQVTVGAKVVFGRHNVVNSYLDVEIGDECLCADGIAILDFDHRFDEPDVAIRRQGIRAEPTRIGRDVWIGTKATVLKGSDLGDGSVVASHAVVRGQIPPFSIVAGVPARVVRSRLPVGMDPHEAAMILRTGAGLPGDPIDG